MLYMTSFQQGTGKKHEREHEAGRRLLAFAVREEYGLEALPAIDRGDYGKPFFPDYPGIHFNISHSGSHAVCVLGEARLGVDIEEPRAVRASMWRRVLTEREQDWLSGRSDKEESFLRLWTLKEAYAKAVGKGLGLNFTAMEFSLSISGGQTEITCSREGSFFQKRLENGAVLSLCVLDGELSEEMRKLHIIF